jgi:hypothetical protein
LSSSKIWVPDRNFQRDAVAALGAGAVAAHAVAAGLGLEMLLVAVVDQRVEAVDGFHPDIAAAAAIAAVRPAELDIFLAPERYAAGATVAGADIDLGLIEEFHLALPIRAFNARQPERREPPALRASINARRREVKAYCAPACGCGSGSVRA